LFAIIIYDENYFKVALLLAFEQKPSLFVIYFKKLLHFIKIF